MRKQLRELEAAALTLDQQQTAWRERIRFELEYAYALCDMHGEEGAEWRPRIDRVSETVTHAAISGSLDSLQKAIGEAESELSFLGSRAKGYTIYCVGHAHIDMNWMWSWPETVATTNDTFTTVLSLLEEYPQFIFSQSQASVYEIMERYNPEALEAITRRVAEGRWEVTASHWVENDKNLSGSESLCRHLLYTRAYIKSLFGLEPEDVPIDWAPDTFGHAHTVPSYLVRGGVKYSYLHRPGVHGNDRRHQVFRWRAPDGSTILVRNDMAVGYNGKLEPAMVTRSLLPFVADTGLPFVMFLYGVGDHGGGPTRRDLRRGVEMQSWPIFPTIEFSKAKTFFERLDRDGTDLPIIDNELNFEFTGCYTTQSVIKKGNRFSEKHLLDLETAASIGLAAAGFHYPDMLVKQGWRHTLFNQFHDILPGSGVVETRSHAHGLYQETEAIAGVEETIALRRLAAIVDTSSAAAGGKGLVSRSEPESFGAGVGRGTAHGNISAAEYRSGADHRPLLLFNPIAVDRADTVQATIWDSGASESITRPGSEAATAQFSVAGPDGQLAPAQIVERGGYWGHSFTRIAFPAALPGLSYGVYTVREEEIELAPDDAADVQQIGIHHPCRYAIAERGPEGLENRFLRVDLDPQTGGIRRLVEKSSGNAVIDAEPAPALLRYSVERARPMSAWEIEHSGADEDAELVELSRAATGPYIGSIVARYKIRDSQMSLTYELRSDDPVLYVHVLGAWVERGGKENGTPVLRLTIPLTLANATTSYEIPFGAITRDMERGEEVPALRWAMVSGDIGSQSAGCLVSNDSKHGHAFRDGSLSVTLIRSSFEPDPLPEMGAHEVHLAIRPFAGSLAVGEAINEARRFDHPVRVVSTGTHAGTLPQDGQFIRLESRTALLAGVKKAEDSEALVLRLHNPAADGEEVSLHFNPDLMGTVTEAVEVDLLERPVATSSATTKRNAVTLTAPAYGITSVRVTLTK